MRPPIKCSRSIFIRFWSFADSLIRFHHWPHITDPTVPAVGKAWRTTGFGALLLGSFVLFYPNHTKEAQSVGCGKRMFRMARWHTHRQHEWRPSQHTSTKNSCNINIGICIMFKASYYLLLFSYLNLPYYQNVYGVFSGFGFCRCFFQIYFIIYIHTYGYQSLILLNFVIFILNLHLSHRTWLMNSCCGQLH